jgi:lipopolysaccharide/colanic/teichoic acid biosynthesis glycosyltransferase
MVFFRLRCANPCIVVSKPLDFVQLKVDRPSDCNSFRLGLQRQVQGLVSDVSIVRPSAIAELDGAVTVGAKRGRRAADAPDVIRAFNIAASLSILVFAAPLMLLIALLIWMQDGGNVLFGHTRIGFRGERFKCLKFRSMVMDADVRLKRLLASDPEAREEWARDHKLRRDPRITPLGAILRKLSLDELPQLINVLRGDMNLVGPRPIVDGEIERYGHYFSHYCSVRPGITGLWQISGRNDVSYRRRVAMDVIYARVRSPLMDMYILLGTIPAVLLRKGSY